MVAERRAEVRSKHNWAAASVLVAALIAVLGCVYTVGILRGDVSGIAVLASQIRSEQVSQAGSLANMAERLACLETSLQWLVGLDISETLNLTP